jgi:hypothetical protein
VLVANDCWDRYRQHPASACSTAATTGRSRAARLNFLAWLETYMHEQGSRDASLWGALRSAQWQTRYPALARLPKIKRRLLVAGAGR